MRRARCLLTALVALTASCSPAAVGPDEAPGPGESRDIASDVPYVVLVSFDGFRHDYQDRFTTPRLDRLAAAGVRAEGLVSVFPSKTFPAHYTIVTGLYPDRHGIVANVFYDPDRRETYRPGDPTVLDGTWYRGEPIWATAESQDVTAASFFWVGSDAEREGAPTYRRIFDSSVPNEARVDGVLEWLSLPSSERPHLVTLYFSLVDAAGHTFGPEGLEVGWAVAEADALLGRLMDGLDLLAFRDRITLVVVSDHGMAEGVTTDEIDLSNLPGVTMINGGAFANFVVDPGVAGLVPEVVRDSLARWLPASEVYLREDVPAVFHLGAEPRAGDVIVNVAEGHLISDIRRPAGTAVGHHGYDPRLQSMNGIFLAMGPGIIGGQVIPRFEMVHIYPWLVARLGLEAARDIDGDPDVLAGYIDTSP